MGTFAHVRAVAEVAAILSEVAHKADSIVFDDTTNKMAESVAQIAQVAAEATKAIIDKELIDRTGEGPSIDAVTNFTTKAARAVKNTMPTNELAQSHRLSTMASGKEWWEVAQAWGMIAQFWGQEYDKRHNWDQW